MNVETLRGPERAERARVHAALADPARLGVIDRLRLGDASPKELQTTLGLPSNLLSHHVGVLERAGLVVRRRSEGDRRRAYLRLVPAVLDDLLPGRRLAASRVVFICSANMARSQLAAALWNRHAEVPATSAGTRPGERVAEGALEAAARHGLTLLPARPRSFHEVLLDDDFFVTVCDSAHEELDRAGLDPDGRRSLHWSVPDPVRTGSPQAFDTAYDDLAARVARLAPQVVAAA